MNNKIILGTVLTALLATTGVVMSDDDEHEGWGGERSFFGKLFGSRRGVEPMTDQLYIDECGSCHFAFQPGLLPARSWEKMMAGLEDHFGENAELDDADTLQILNMLTAGSSDKSDYHRSQKINRSIQRNSSPLRISETPYFVRKHDELPARYVTGNPKVRSFSNCETCHTEADKGSFSERGINIPGFGRWED